MQIENEHEFITGVAIIVDGQLYKACQPFRHHHLIHLVYEKTGKQVITESQGFITNKDRYITREEALTIAKQANQLLDRHNHPTKLFSESLW